MIFITLIITLLLACIVSLYVGLYLRLLSLNVEKNRAKVFSLVVYIFPVKLLKQYLRDIKNPNSILFRFKDEVKNMTHEQYVIFRKITKSRLRLFIMAFSPLLNFRFYLHYLTKIILKEERLIKKIEEKGNNNVRIKIKIKEMNRDTSFNMNDFIKKQKTKLS